MSVLERGRGTAASELMWRADWIRLKTIELISIAKSGHYSSVFSCAEILATLYYSQLRLNPADPAWLDRDRLVLGKGHAAVGLYPCLADLGYFPKNWLESYARLGSPLGDHPDMRKVPGIDFSSGSIGHNLSVGVGMALAGRMQRRSFRTWAILGDGEMHEGQIWEAAMSASHFRLGNLTTIIDYNQMCLDGFTNDVMGIEPLAERWMAFGWNVIEIDGHNVASLLRSFAEVPDTESDVPVCIIAHTIKGKGVSFMELSPYWHLGYLGASDQAIAEGEIRNRMEVMT